MHAASRHDGDAPGHSLGIRPDACASGRPVRGWAVYQSQYAGTNKATAVTWVVGADVEGVVRALEAKGVVFEHYDMPGMTRQGDLHVAGGMKVAWFKDPDGNIHSLTNR